MNMFCGSNNWCCNLWRIGFNMALKYYSGRPAAGDMGINTNLQPSSVGVELGFGLSQQKNSYFYSLWYFKCESFLLTNSLNAGLTSFYRSNLLWFSVSIFLFELQFLICIINSFLTLQFRVKNEGSLTLIRFVTLKCL